MYAGCLIAQHCIIGHAMLFGSLCAQSIECPKSRQRANPFESKNEQMTILAFATVYILRSHDAFSAC